jgi:hypothetical protein
MSDAVRFKKFSLYAPYELGINLYYFRSNISAYDGGIVERVAVLTVHRIGEFLFFTSLLPLAPATCRQKPFISASPRVGQGLIFELLSKSKLDFVMWKDIRQHGTPFFGSESTSSTECGRKCSLLLEPRGLDWA